MNLARIRSFPTLLPALLLGLLAVLALPVSAEEKSDKVRTYEELQSEIEIETQRIGTLEKRLESAEGIYHVAIDARRMRARMATLELQLEFLRLAAADVAAGKVSDEGRKRVDAVFAAQLKAIDDTRDIMIGRIKLPEEKQAPAVEAAAYSRIFQQIDQVNRIFEINIETLALGEQLGQDVAALSDALKQSLRDRAENGSVLLELAMSDVVALQASTSAVPDDAESKARLNVVTSHVTSLANAMTRILGMMDSLQMDTGNYQNQLLLATGQITSDILQVGVFTNLFLGWGETLWNGVIENGPTLIFNLVLLVAIIFLFYKLSGVAHRLTEAALERSHFELSLLLKRMVVSIVRNTVLFIGVLIGLSQIGVSLGPLFAGMGLVGFVVGFALQDTLSNFAAGLMILIYRPFDVDDIIDAGGVSGVVGKMSLVNTTILTLDNQTIIVPNSKIWGDVIKNVTAQTMRRIDLVFGIAYSDDIEKAEKVMAEVVAAHPAVLEEPATMIKLHELGDSSVNFVVRPWVNREDYWDTYWDLMRSMKMRFDEEGISIPFPQRDVHLYKET